jgi:hypothetical protein
VRYASAAIRHLERRVKRLEEVLLAGRPDAAEIYNEMQSHAQGNRADER